MNKKIIRKILLLSTMMFSFTHLFPYDQTHINNTLSSYLDSHGSFLPKIEPKPIKPALGERIKNYFTPKQIGFNTIPPRTLLELGMKAYPLSANKSDDIINQHFINKLEIVKSSNVNDNLINRLTTIDNNTHYASTLHTVAGKISFLNFISQPTNNLCIIKQRQAIIKELVENKALRESCEKILKQARDAEPHFLSFFEQESIANQQLLEQLYSSYLPFINNSSIGLELKIRLSNLWSLGLICNISATTFFITRLPQHFMALYAPDLLNQSIALNQMVIAQNPSIAHEFQKEIDAIKAIKNNPKSLKVIAKLMYQDFRGYFSSFKSLYQDKEHLTLGISSLCLLVRATLAMNGINNLLTQYNLIHAYLQSRLIATATYVRSMQEIHALVSKNKVIALNSNINHLLCNNASQSSNFRDLVQLLLTNTFSGQTSCFSWAGKILRTYKLIQDESVQMQFKDALQVFGELDVYVAIAKKIVAQKNETIPYTLVQFVENNTPGIRARNFGNPFISNKNNVPNSIEFGFDKPRNIILTGPNTGGKSTVMKGLMLNVLLAHTFGIALAEEFTLTLFHKLPCYLNITDNTAAGISLFKAEVLQAKELSSMIHNLKEKEFAFVIIDEIFTGTAPEKAEELAYEFLEDLSTSKQCLFLDATHFKKLTHLEQEANSCKNYHMGYVLNNQGLVEKYTYKITEGTSTINNASQIAHAEKIV